MVKEKKTERERERDRDNRGKRETEKKEIKESMLHRNYIERFGFSKKEYFQYIFSVKKCANIDNILMKEKFYLTVDNIRLNKYMADSLKYFH